LPILVEGFTSPLGKTILIEQPEIHLHPKMQGELADLFIDIANVKPPKKDADSGIEPELNRYLVIETHSEYLLSRLRRRISERRISHSDVALYFVEKSENGSRIRGVPIPVTGHFEWPEEFYEDDLNDTISFLQNAAKAKD
jgi:predicted ATPase